MRIRLHANAAAAYVRRCYKRAHPQCGMLHRPEWKDMLEKVEGQWLEVETDYLFDAQFNTAPIPGVSEHGMRLMAEDVAEIEDDVRPGRVFDQYTHKHYAPDELPAKCLTPERLEYLKVFKPKPGSIKRGLPALVMDLKPYEPDVEIPEETLQ